jgi:hypothetical protein
MLILTVTRICVFAICSGLMAYAATGAVISPARDTAEQLPEEIKQPLNMDEPMQGGMKKKGMLKGDVKASAEKKDKKMQEMLEKEEQSMPPKSQQAR